MRTRTRTRKRDEEEENSVRKKLKVEESSDSVEQKNEHDEGSENGSLNRKKKKSAKNTKSKAQNAKSAKSTIKKQTEGVEAKEEEIEQKIEVNGDIGVHDSAHAATPTAEEPELRSVFSSLTSINSSSPFSKSLCFATIILGNTEASLVASYIANNYTSTDAFLQKFKISTISISLYRESLSALLTVQGTSHAAAACLSYLTFYIDYQCGSMISRLNSDKACYSVTLLADKSFSDEKAWKCQSLFKSKVWVSGTLRCPLAGAKSVIIKGNATIIAQTIQNIVENCAGSLDSPFSPAKGSELSFLGHFMDPDLILRGNELADRNEKTVKDSAQKLTDYFSKVT